MCILNQPHEWGAMFWKVFKLAIWTMINVKIKCGINITMGQENKWLGTYAYRVGKIIYEN
jgi:hypothetical protein